MDCINSYAVVAYLAGPIARFVDRLRSELDSGGAHHAHITILSPREMSSSVAEAIEFARQQVAKFEPFQVQVGEVEAFRDTNVIYLAMSGGACELTALHDVLNTGLLEQQEAYDYVPHITLGQQFVAGSLEGLLEESRRRWTDFGPPPPLPVERVTFVQQRADSSWEDVAELGLGRLTTVG